jgi:hypothetical protein
MSSRQPTIIVDVIDLQFWKNRLYDIESSMIDIDDNIMTFSYLAVNNQVISGDCISWSMFLEEVLFLQYGPKKVINITMFKLINLSGALLENSLACNDKIIVTSILNAMMSKSQLSSHLMCNNNEWNIGSNCSNNELEIALNHSTQCDNECSSNVFQLSPCSQGVCSREPSTGGYLLLLGLYLADRNQPPHMDSISVVSYRSSLQIDATFSNGGVLYCMASLQPMISRNEVLQSSFFSFIVFNTNSSEYFSSANIYNLIPSTLYTIYCVTESTDGSLLSSTQMIANAVSASTLCCKEIHVSLLISAGLEKTVYTNALSISVSHLPTDVLSIELICEYSETDDDSLVTDVFPFFQSSINLTSSSLISTYNIGLKDSSAGFYELKFKLSSSSSMEYNLVYDSQKLITVYSAYSEPPTPQLLSAIFSNDGLSILISFSSPTNRGGYKSSLFQCSYLFQFSNADIADCIWNSSSTATVYIDSNIDVSINSNITVLANLLQAECGFDTGCDNDNWKFIEQKYVKIMPPDSPVTPSVSLSAPSYINGRSDLVLDFSCSYGSGGRKWASHHFDILNQDSIAANAIKNLLNEQDVSTQIVTVPHSLLSSDTRYVISLSLCNFLGGCGTGTTHVTVVNKNDWPELTVIGPSSIEMYRKSKLQFSVQVSISSNILYYWKIYRNNIELVGDQYISKSIEAGKYLLDSYVLDVNSDYSVKLTVFNTISRRSNFVTFAVHVMQSNIIAYIVGGINRIVKGGASIILDGSKSYDDDYGSGADFTYNWKCIQISPVYDQKCPVTLHDSMSSVVTVYGNADKLDSVAYITLTVNDNTRYAETSVYVTTRNHAAPEVKITTTLASQMNPSSKLKLKGVAVMETSGTVEWSLYDSTMSITDVSLVHVTHSVTVTNDAMSEIPFYLSLASNTLSARTTYTLRLSSTLLSGEYSSTSIDVSTNGPPLPGYFDVTPQEGEMLYTNFSFVSTQWEDEDLPVYFAFGYVLYDGSINIIQRRSLKSLCVSQLPSGREIDDFKLTVFTQPYDSLGANFTMSTLIRVNEIYFSRYDLQQYMSAVLTVGSLDSNMGVISTINSILNKINCSATPDCKARHRYECINTPNTCGSCIEGYIGVEGDSNSNCISETVDRTSHIDMSCTYNSSICSDFWMKCVSGKCVAMNQPCVSDCNNHGQCLHREISTRVIVPSCKIGNPSCEAFCECDRNYGGQYCTYTLKELIATQNLRGMLISNYNELVQSMDVSIDMVQSWISTLKSLTKQWDEIHLASIDNILSVVGNIINATKVVTVQYENIVELNNVISSTLSIIQSANISDDTLGSSIKQYLLYIGEVVSEDMVIGENDVISYTSNMKMLTSLQYTYQNITLNSPLNQLENYHEIKPQSFTMLPADKSDQLQYTSITMVTLSSSAYGNNSLVSDPIIIHMPDSVNSNNFVISMQTNNKSLHLIDNVNNTEHYVETVCSKDVVGPVSVTGCPNTILGDIVVYCNGTAAIITTQCPQYEATLSCVTLQYSSDVICHTISHSDTNVTCHCTLRNINSNGTSSSAILDAGENGDNMGSSSSRDSKTTVEFSAMIKSVSSNFIETWSSADDISAHDVLRSWKVLATVCSIFGLVAVAMAFSIHQDKSVSINPQKEDIYATSTKNLNKSSRNIERVSTEMKMIEETLPMAFRTAPLLERFTVELKKYHRWLCIWFYYSPNFPRVLRVISLSTSVIAMLFIQAVTYNIAEVDDGSCEYLNDSSSCLNEPSTLDQNANKCYWDEASQTCNYLEASNDLMRVVFVAVVSAMWSAPIAIGANWLIMNVLAAKIAVSLKIESDRSFKTHSIVLGSNNRHQFPFKKQTISEQTVANEVHELNEAVIQYKDTLSDSEQREYEGMTPSMLLYDFILTKVLFVRI